MRVRSGYSRFFNIFFVRNWARTYRCQADWRRAMTNDTVIEQAIAQVRSVMAGALRAPQVKPFFHEPAFTASYVVSDPVATRAAIIDSVWDFDTPSGRTSFNSAYDIVAPVREQDPQLDWILEHH